MRGYEQQNPTLTLVSKFTIFLATLEEQGLYRRPFGLIHAVRVWVNCHSRKG